MCTGPLIQGFAGQRQALNQGFSSQQANLAAATSAQSAAAGSPLFAQGQTPPQFTQAGTVTQTGSQARTGRVSVPTSFTRVRKRPTGRITSQNLLTGALGGGVAGKTLLGV